MGGRGNSGGESRKTANQGGLSVGYCHKLEGTLCDCSADGDLGGNYLPWEVRGNISRKKKKREGIDKSPPKVFIGSLPKGYRGHIRHFDIKKRRK